MPAIFPSHLSETIVRYNERVVSMKITLVNKFALNSRVASSSISVNYGNQGEINVDLSALTDVTSYNITETWQFNRLRRWYYVLSINTA